MQQYKQDFITFLVKAGALKFGSFKLKSGRMAPYFIHMGSFFSGPDMYTLGKFYAAALLDTGIDYDVLFGPAYKGIPLAVATTAVLHREHGTTVGYAFNRKEAKEHGMKDQIIGAPMSRDTKVFLVDDVMTAGTAVRDSVEFLKHNGDPQLVGILIAVDRMEKNNDGVSAVQAIQEALHLRVFSIVTLDDVVSFLHNKPIGGVVYIDDEKLRAIREYREQYGV